MEMHNLKFHFTAIAIIVGLIVIGFFLTEGGPEKVLGEDVSDKFIQVARATWGQNCDQYITQTRERSRRAGTPMPPDMVPVNANNVLLPISEHCNGQDTCEISVTDDFLGAHIGPRGCAKQLEVQYRCYSWDRVWIETADMYDSMTLDCRDK